MRSVTGRPRELQDRGSVSVFVAVIAVAFALMAGLAVDVSGHIHAMQEARSVAREAARAGGQQLEVATGVRGVDAIADPGRAAAAAQAYLAQAGVTGSASVSGPDSISVEVTSVYPTKFLSIVGVSGLSATGTADARITRSLQGVEQ
ncbi:pilus assembly protein TadG-related protein [Ornithinimicrobium sp. F0845]|uniref:TadE/TadG family type IV pilus assembly protein n=1 Tax=Ornithinimicrobium sp. F0845 TaxID=2926412 RepID=UPI001FF43904|nr:pilus assembly protein TadG-related protein [Ornithinimicrobium sp. F0845]MCK0113529.1 pilus assembly protein TadG-related protein [Ornithinimicrobium sp. F0845]